MLADTDLELERAALACMICSAPACFEAMSYPLVRDHFTREQHVRMLRCVERCFQRSGDVDVALLHSYLVECGLSDSIGWDDIVAMTDYVPNWQMIRAYMPRLEDLRIRRAKRLAVEEAAEAIQKGDDERVDQILEKAGQLKTRKRAKKSIAHQMQEMQDRLDGKAGLRLLTGWPSIDRRLRISRTRMYGLAGREKEGKTTLALQLAVGIARNGGAVHVFSAEMSQSDCNLLLMRAMTGLAIEEGELAKLSPDERAFFDQAKREREALPIEIDDVNKTLPEVVREAKRLRGKVALFIVDHSSIVQVPGMDKVRGVPEVTRACKQVLAVDGNAACILLSQYNGTEWDGDEPGLENIYGGRALSQDANAVMMILRESYRGASKGDGAKLIVPVMRDGRHCGTIPLRWEHKGGRYQDPEEVPF